MTSFRLLSPRDFRRVPWRNGGGTSSEIASWPAHAGGDAFAGRVSIAGIERDGAFSTWPGVDRALVLLDGDGIVLAHDGAKAELRPLDEPYRFPGDHACECRLVGGPARAFNLMVRRGDARGELVVADAAMAIAGAWRIGVCYAARGSCECLLAGRAPVAVGAGHALVVDGAGPIGTLHVNPIDAGAVAVLALLELPA
jgi:environmental stress-induced protein Ves